MNDFREFDFIGVLNTLLDRGTVAYKEYLNNEKKFLYAKILKNNNDLIRDLLIQNTHILTLPKRQDAMALLHHIDVWSTIWEDLEKKENPHIHSIFVFDNAVNFPSSQVERLRKTSGALEKNSI